MKLRYAFHALSGGAWDVFHLGMEETLGNKRAETGVVLKLKKTINVVKAKRR